MLKGRSHIPATVVFIAFVAVTVLAGGCGGGPSPGSSAAAPAGTPMEIATKILGHAPTGLAKTIVERGSVVVANDEAYAPQSSIDQDTGKLVGFDVDVADQMAKLLGLTVDFKNPAWETVPTGLQKGKFDVSIGSMPVTPLLQKDLAFSAPYYYAPGQVVVRKGGLQITGVKSLFGKTVGVGAATVYYDFLKGYPQITVRTYADDAGALADLGAGNVDFVMTSSSIGRLAIVSGQPLAFSGKPLYYLDLAFAIKKDEPDWLALLDHTVAAMHENGQLTAMSKKWFHGLDLTVKQ
jgi:polar amino acid transport system substrate-binding protein